MVAYPTLAAENARDAWGWRWLDGLLADLRYAVRVLTRQPSFTLVALFSLALGIGANAAIFSLMDTVLWRDLPVREPARLVRFNQGSSISYLAYSRYAEQGGQAMDAIFGEAGVFTLPLDSGGGPQKGGVYLVTGNFFQALGVPAVVGRALSAEDDRRSSPQPVAMLSYRYWQRAFAGDPAVAGRSLRSRQRAIHGGGCRTIRFPEPQYRRSAGRLAACECAALHPAGIRLAGSFQ